MFFRPAKPTVTMLALRKKCRRDRCMEELRIERRWVDLTIGTFESATEKRWEARQKHGHVSTRGHGTHGSGYGRRSGCAGHRHAILADQLSNRPSISLVTDRGVSWRTSSMIFQVISPSWPVATVWRKGTVAARS